MDLIFEGKVSFNNRNLHAIGDTPNPYEEVISIIGKTLTTLDEDNLIPCFGFGDETTNDEKVFSFHNNKSACHGFKEVLDCYKKIVPNLRQSGPTSYAPIVDAAVDIVERSNGQYHVLVIIADGQVTKSVNTRDAKLSPQEEKTIDSITSASYYPLSIVLVGVGDGPWDYMKEYHDKIPARLFDNFQFVNFTKIMSKNDTSSEQKEFEFALAALMKIPIQYTTIQNIPLLGQKTGKAKKVYPLPPPGKVDPLPPPEPCQARFPSRQPNNVSSTKQNEVCPICLTNTKDTALEQCGHITCGDCSRKVSNCPFCRKPITSRRKVFLDS